MALVPKQCLSNTLLRNMVFPYLRVWKSSHVDQIDCFTNDLVEKRNSQWQMQMERCVQDEIKYLRSSRKANVQEVKRKLQTHLEIDVRNLDECQMKNLLLVAMEEENTREFDRILGESMKWRRNLSEEIIWDMLEFVTEAGRRDILEKVREFCRETYPEFLLMHQGFVSHEIRILWKEGNTEKAMEMMREMYREIRVQNLPEARRILRVFARETVGEKSEAVLVALINLTEEISTDSGDQVPLEILWRDCFFSRWFSDQQIAVKLFRKHQPIRDFVQQQVKIMVFRLLLKHRLETVYRLIELLLDPSVDMKASCKDALKLLFDYQFWRHNSHGCSEIIQSSINLSIPLGAEYEKKLVILLLKPRMIIYSRDKPTQSVKYKF